MYSLICKLMSRMHLLTLSSGLLQNKIPVLMYHGIAEHHNSDDLSEFLHMNVLQDEFARQMEYLHKNYTVISLSEAVQLIEKNAKLPRRLVVITFDDGYRNNYKLAWPICRELDLPFTIYVATDFVEKQSLLWGDRLALALQFTEKQSITFLEKCYSLRSHSERSNTLWQILACMKGLHADQVEGMISDIELELRASPDSEALERYRACSWQDLKEMSDSDLVEIGAHTMGHKIIARLSDRDIRKELIGSKKIIETMTGARCGHFCYPNGKPDDFNDQCQRLVREAGFDSASTTIEGFAGAGDNCYALKRLGVYGHYNFEAFLGVLGGIHTALTGLRGRV
ncbi:polysaccharide deacetylase family protein [bacterium]|nr:polysaccharide deacetylase family protein [bacterium]